MSYAKFNYINSAGNVKEGELRLEDYREAEKRGMRTSAYVNAKYSDADPKYGTAFQQGMENLGIYTKGDPKRGIVASTVGDILEGTVSSQMAAVAGGTIVTPSTQGTTPATRVFFPEVVMNLMNEKLIEDYNPEMAIWNRMISGIETINSEMFTQPQIDVTNPRSERSIPTSQNALPRTLVSITTSQYSKSITTNSIGLQISEQAQRTASIDLVTTILTQQAEGERYAKLWEDIGYIVSGNTDAGQAALSGSAINTTNDEITQAEWLAFLYDPTRKVNYDSILCTLTDFLTIQDRSGRPMVYDPNGVTGNLGTYGLNVEPNLLNWSVGVPNVMLVPAGTFAANTVVAFDSRYAMRKVVNSSASYSATERMVLQRTDVFRFDFGELTYRLNDDAFKLGTIARA